ncbi:3-oxoacyl-ACP synthase [Streptomyces sp. NRRL B-1568]|nr:3-oxoacyl-ACP synthase [Streptomyces sp. NRRL B-1568]
MTTLHPYIAGMGSALPGEPVTNAALGAALGIDEEWVDIFVGTRTRHFAWDLATGDVHHTLADLCAEAAGEAVDAAGLDAADIEFLVLATATPDALLPTTATEVADRLGLNYLPVYQLQSGCSGAVQGVDLARSLIAGGSRAGLVIGGDTTHRHLDAGREARRLPGDELVNYVLFGDGAGAAVLTAEPLGEAVAVRGVLNHFTGLGRPAGQRVDWYGRGDDPGRPMISEDYKAIEDNVPTMAAEILWELLDRLGWREGDVDFLLPPQLSGRMTERITERLGLAAREISCVADTGNTGNALPFLQLEKLLPELAPGQRALAIAVESSKWIKSGLGLQKTGEGAS